MDNFSLKAFGMISTLVVSLIGGYLPLWYERQHRGQVLLTRGYYFAKGIFLGAALMHLMPTAHTHFEHAYPDLDYPMMGFVVLLTIFVLHAIEHYSVAILGRFAKLSSHMTIYLLILTLSMHSIIEGAALGVGTSVAEITIILIALLAHKSADSFALVINMQRHGFKRSTITPVMLVFSCMTPLGVTLGAALTYLVSGAGSNWLLMAYVDAITAGTFIYIACLEQGDMPELHDSPGETTWETLSFGAGILLMSVVAFWI